MLDSKKSFIRSLIGFSISSWVGFVIGIISVPILTRLLDPTQYAIINQFNSAILFFMSLVTIGMDSGFVRFFFEPPAGFSRRQLLGKCLWYSTLILVILGVLCVPFYRRLANLLFGIDSWVISLLFFLAILSQIIIRFFTIYYRMLNKIFAFTVLAILFQLFSKFSLLTALPFHGDNIILLSANTFGLTVLAIGVFLSNTKNHSYSWSPKSLWVEKEFKNYSFGSWLVPLVIYANIYFGQIVIRYYAGEKILGIYLSANLFAGILGVVQYGFTNFWSVYMFENYDKNQCLIKKIHDYVCLFSILALSCFILMKDLLYLFIGDEFQASKPIFALVLTAPLFTMIVDTTAYGISIKKKAHLSLLSYSSYFILNILLTIIFVPIWGILGAALSLMLSALVNLIQQTLFGQMYYRSVETLKRTAFAIFVIVLLSLLNYSFDGNKFVTIAVILSVVLVSSIVYLKPLKYALVLTKNFYSN